MSAPARRRSPSMVWFVDDDPFALHGLRRMIRQYAEEWEARFFDDPRELLAELDAPTTDGVGMADVIVTDIQMPHVDGFALLAATRERFTEPELPVVLVTGRGDPLDKRRALDLGATDLLHKPVDGSELSLRIRNSLRLADYHRRIVDRAEELEDRVLARTRELEDSRRDVIWALARASDSRDRDTGYHVVRVGLFAGALARTLGESEAFARQLTLAAPLHDVGKIGIPDAVLRKPGPLTEEEREVMQEHCAIGARILTTDPAFHHAFAIWRDEAHDSPIEMPPANPTLQMAADVALSHHERWDGSGYPQRLRGEAIPLSARITAVADVYDALAHARSYKPAYSDARVLSELQRGAGSHFDPRVLDVFMRTVPVLEALRVRFMEHGADQEVAA